MNTSKKYYCRRCGQSANSIATLTSMSCFRNGNKKHELYEGGEKLFYSCKHCGQTFNSLATLTSMHCYRRSHNEGVSAYHEPAL